MTYIKYGAIGLLVLALFFGGWYCGALKSKAQLDRSLAAQSATVTAALIAQRKISDAEEARLNAVIAKYEADKATPDPITLDIGKRLYKYQVSECPVQPPGKDPTRTVVAPAEPKGDSRLEQLYQSAFDACEADAKQLSALQEAWPRQ